jgi:hypothetical protein
VTASLSLEPTPHYRIQSTKLCAVQSLSLASVRPAAFEGIPQLSGVQGRFVQNLEAQTSLILHQTIQLVA